MLESLQRICHKQKIQIYQFVLCIVCYLLGYKDLLMNYYVVKILNNFSHLLSIDEKYDNIIYV